MAVPNGTDGEAMKHYKKKAKKSTIAAPRSVLVRIPDGYLPKEPIIFNGDKYVCAFSTSTAWVPGTVTLNDPNNM